MKILLFALLAFVAVTACICGLIMILKPGGQILNLPLAFLKPTPFKDFLIPGIVLFALPGCTAAAALYASVKKSRYYYRLAIFAGIMISGWIIVQVLMIRLISPLHFIYLGAGILMMLIAYKQQLLSQKK